MNTNLFLTFNTKLYYILAIYIKQKHLIKILKFWGPSFEIRFRIKVKSFDGQVLHLCTGRETVDGVPTVEAINDRLVVTTIVGSKKEKFFTKRLETRVWYYVEILQKQSKKNPNKVYENHDMAIAMSSSRADPVLGLNIPSSCPGLGYLNI